ncbi:AMP-binding protein [Nocardioides insulae]|uniref:AMP-binding protein n=1 Tax=Nocardioides insulae TaxID=394734 RepID=UPI0004188FF8|nr:AMP-binding protein [Nocardioides insulae]
MSALQAPRHPATYAQSPVVNALARDRDRTVVEMVGGTAWTGGDLLRRISQLHQALRAAGVGEGMRVALLSGNSIEVLLLHNALGFAGGCLVALHPMGSADDHLFAIEDGEVEVLIYDPRSFGDRAVELDGRHSFKAILSLGEGEVGNDLLAAADGFEEAELVPPVVSPDAITRLSYSGGTTGTPKAIPGSPRVSATALSIMLSDWEWPIEPRVLAVVPLSHAGGSLFAPTVIKNGSMVVMSHFDPGSVLKAIEDHRITCMMLVPTMIYALLDHPDFDSYDLSSLETVFYGASLMSPTRLKEAIERIGPVFFQFYGQAESPMTVTVMRRSEHDPNDLRRLASCGRPVPWLDVQLLDDANRPVPDGEPGEICVRGPLVMDGYLNREELNREVFADGWLHTGDVAVKDPDGFLRIVDRKKDMIVTGGFNVFPSEVENVIAEHPAVGQVAVFGTPDEKWGEAVTAAVVLRPGGSVDADHLISLVRTHKGPVQAPKRIEFLDALPQTAVGKLDKRALRSQFAQQ